jgi:hypothetical protein
MKIIRPELLLKHINDEFALLSLVEDQGTIKIQTLKASLIIFRNLIQNSIEETNEEDK